MHSGFIAVNESRWSYQEEMYDSLEWTHQLKRKFHSDIIQWNLDDSNQQEKIESLGLQVEQFFIVSDFKASIK